MKIELKSLIKWRNIWMGVAILWTIWFHSGLNISNPILYTLKCWGYGGVDIFLFASGLGCYFSLDKNNDFSEFIKRRIVRIVPTYWLFLVIWCLYKRWTIGLSIPAILGNFLFVQSYTGLGNDFNWYIGAMWLLYFLAPFFYSVIKKYNSVMQYLGMIVFLVLITIPFCGSEFIIMVTRIPIFFIGMCLAKLVKENVVIETKEIIALIVLMIIGIVSLWWFQTYCYAILWTHGLYWYPFIAIIPGMCMLISLIMEKISNFRIGKYVERCLSVLGNYSFEIFLVHALMFDIYRAFFIAFNPKYNWDMYWYIVIVLIVPCCMLFIGANKLISKIANKVTSFIKK